MKQRSHIQQTSNVSPFLGLFEGKRKAAKADAQISVINAQTQAQKDLLSAQLAAQAAGYVSDSQRQTEAQSAATAADAKSNTQLYVIIAVVVIAVMVGLYFIVKK